MTALPMRSVWQGDTVHLDFVLREPDGSALDLTGAVVVWSMADPDDIDTPVLEKTSSGGGGVTVLEAISGTCRVSIPAGEMDTPGTYVQEIEATKSGATYTYGQGRLIVKPTVMPT